MQMYALPSSHTMDLPILLQHGSSVFSSLTLLFVRRHG